MWIEIKDILYNMDKIASVFKSKADECNLRMYISGLEDDYFVITFEFPKERDDVYKILKKILCAK